MLIAAATTAVLFALWHLGVVLPRGGPLDGAGARASSPVDAGDVVTVAFPVANEELDEEVEIRSATPVGVSPHLEIVDVAIGRCRRANGGCLTMTYDTWPPRRVVVEDDAGFRLGRDDHVFVVVGVRVPEEPGRYGIRAVEVDYSQGWRRHRGEAGWEIDLRVRNPR